jgi:hypothetical protein
VPTPKEILDGALDQLVASLRFESNNGVSSDTLVVATGTDDPSVPKALACYAVGVLAGWVQYDATTAERFAVQASNIEMRSRSLYRSSSTRRLRQPEAVFAASTSWLRRAVGDHVAPTSRLPLGAPRLLGFRLAAVAGIGTVRREPSSIDRGRRSRA